MAPPKTDYVILIQAEYLHCEFLYRQSLKIRKRIEEVFSWTKTVGPLRQTKFRGMKKVAAQAIFTFAAYKLARMSAIFGW
ncbi:transposase [Methylomonas montana]|uniref:transposase n=1 Tax=Methylomonas montana TaxID=3058963 RepID=UPI00387EDCCB